MTNGKRVGNTSWEEKENQTSQVARSLECISIRKLCIKASGLPYLQWLSCLQLSRPFYPENNDLVVEPF